MEDYNKQREFKIEKVVDKCYEFFTTDDAITGINNVKEYVEKNAKCKLPWSDTELIAARESVRQLLHNKLQRLEREDKEAQLVGTLTASTTSGPQASIIS